MNWLYRAIFLTHLLLSRENIGPFLCDIPVPHLSHGGRNIETSQLIFFANQLTGLDNDGFETFIEAFERAPKKVWVQLF